jgi:hypothetical protein
MLLLTLYPPIYDEYEAFGSITSKALLKTSLRKLMIKSWGGVINDLLKLKLGVAISLTSSNITAS